MTRLPLLLALPLLVPAAPAHAAPTCAYVFVDWSYNPPLAPQSACVPFVHATTCSTVWTDAVPQATVEVGYCRPL